MAREMGRAFDEFQVLTVSPIVECLLRIKIVMDFSTF